ncbi:MAG: DUF2062 domain-containing protein [Campylobacterales bacterium]
MIRRFAKKTRHKDKKKLEEFLDKYKIPREAVAINRRSVSRGISIGLFIAFIPMPFQMLALVALFPVFRFNIPLSFIMVWISNPVTMPFMYYIEYLTGSMILGNSVTSVELTLEWFKEHIDDIFIPLYIGAFFYSTLFASIFYYLINRLWIYSVRLEKSLKDKAKKSN